MPLPPRTPTVMDAPEDSRTLDRWYIAGLLCMAALIVAFPVYNYGEPARRARAQHEMATSNVEIGRAMFAQHCAACHGDEARGGRGVPTLAAREFLNTVSDKQLHWLISGGVPGSAMTAYDIDLGGPFTSQEIARLAVYLRSLETDAPSVPGWFKGDIAPLRLRKAARGGGQRDGSREARQDNRQANRRDEARAAAGGIDSTTMAAAPSRQVTEVFATRCAMCHGPAGQGTPLAPSVRPLRPALLQQPDRIFAIVARGVPATAMQAFSNRHGGTIDDTTIRDLVAWMHGPVPR